MIKKIIRVGEGLVRKIESSLWHKSAIQEGRSKYIVNYPFTLKYRDKQSGINRYIEVSKDTRVDVIFVKTSSKRLEIEEIHIIEDRIVVKEDIVMYHKGTESNLSNILILLDKINDGK